MSNEDMKNMKKWTKQRKPNDCDVIEATSSSSLLFEYIQYKWIWTTIHIIIWSVLVVMNIFLNCLSDDEWWVYEIYQFVFFGWFSLFCRFFRLFILCDI